MADWWDSQPKAEAYIPSGDTTGDNWWEAAPEATRARGYALNAPKKTPDTPPPTLMEAGWEGLKGDIRTGASRVAQSLGWDEWAKLAREDAEKNYDEQARRPIQSLDDSIPGGIYEGAVSSIPGMAPVMAGGYTGAMIGAPLGPIGAGAGAILGGLAGALPQFLGSNLKRQMEEKNIPLSETELPPALGAAVVQGGLDSALNLLLPGIGKAAKAGLFARMAVKGAEGMGVEALTEASQQWLEVLQANPEKAWAMPKEVQKELLHAAVIGGAMGGAVGAASGLRKGRTEESVPPGSQPPAQEGTPPEGNYEVPQDIYFNSAGPLQQPEFDITKEPYDQPQPPPPSPPWPEVDFRTHTPAAGFENGVPEINFDGTKPPNWRSDRSGLPYTDVPFEGDSSVMGLPEGPGPAPQLALPAPSLVTPPPPRPKPDLSPENVFNLQSYPRPAEEHLEYDKKLVGKFGEKVFEDVQQKLVAAGVNKIEAAANARVWQERYQNLGRQLGISAIDAYKMSDVEVLGPNNRPAAAPKVKDPKVSMRGKIADLQAQGVPFKDAVIQAGTEIGVPFKQFEQQPIEKKVKWSSDPKAWVNDNYGHVTEDVPIEWLESLLGNGLRRSGSEQADLVRSMESEGIREPLTIMVGKNTSTAKLGEGNHRLRAAKELGWTHVPARVVVGSEYGSGTSARSDIIPKKGEYFRSDAKPSDVFRTIKGNRTLEQRARAAQPTPQGNITFTPNDAVIRLFKTANASTFLHESAHLWLEEMTRYAPHNAQMAADLKTVMDWFGITDPSQITTKHHEQWARGFEQYVRGGKFHIALAKLFQQFRQWLLSIYSKAESLNVEVPPEIAKVYDRLFRGAEESNPPSSPIGVDPGATRTLGQDKSFNQDQAFQLSRWQNMKRRTKAFFDPFSEVEVEDQYRDIRNLMVGGVQGAEESAIKAKKIFDSLNQKERDQVNQYFETPNANPQMVPSRIRPETVGLKNYINGALKTNLVKAGLLSQGAAQSNEDSYLPRLYLKHLLEADGYKGGARLSRLYAKKRRTQTEDALVAMGEVKDPGVRAFHAIMRTERDLAVMDYLKKVAANPKWAHPRSTVDWDGHKVTPDWLKAEADAIEDRMEGEPNPDRKKKMQDVADRMRQTARAALAQMGQEDFEAAGFSKLPNTRDYGPLRGLYVQRQIAEDIKGTNNFVNEDNPIDRWFGDKNSALTRATSVWKMLKVPLNPPSQVRNLVSNYILLNLSGVRIDKVGVRLVQAMNDMRQGGKYSQIAKKYGVGKGTFSEQELYAISDELNKLSTKDQAGFAGWRAITRAAMRFGKTATDVYGKSEVWFKIAKIIDEMEGKNAKENDAVRAANKALFDYSEAHPSVKRLRQMPLGLPFLCVDPETEILTQRGWLRHDEVVEGDMTASFSMENERLSWQPILEIFRAPYKGDMIHVRNGKLDMFMTPNHRCVTYRNNTGKPKIRFAEELNTQDAIPGAAPFDHIPVGEPITDGMAELLGWYISEGHMHRKCDAVWINQNEGSKADTIRSVLRKCNFPYRDDVLKPRNGSTKREVHFYIPAEYGRKIRELCPDKKLTPALVMRMSSSQVRLFIDAFIAGDGSINKNTKLPVIIQKDKTTLDSLQMALSILGESYGICRRSTGTSSIQIRRHKRHRLARRPIIRVMYDDLIWCPKTPDGTWVARRNGKVFISGNTFQYKMIPEMLDAVRNRPTAFLPYIALGATIPALVAGMNDIDQEDGEKLRKSLAKQLRRRDSMYLLPWKNDAGLWQFIDIGYFMPWQMPWEFTTSIGKAGLNVAKGKNRDAIEEMGDAFRTTGLMSNPTANVIAAMTTGVDPFTGRPIADKRDPAGKQVMDIMGYLWNMATPSLLAGYGAAGMLKDRLEGTGVNRHGEPQMTPGGIAARALGINTYPVMPDAQRGRNIVQMQRDIQDAKSRMTSSLKDQSLTPAQRRSIVESFREEISERARALQDYVRESAPSERLRAATARP